MTVRNLLLCTCSYGLETCNFYKISMRIYKGSMKIYKGSMSLFRTPMRLQYLDIRFHSTVPIMDCDSHQTCTCTNKLFAYCNMVVYRKLWLLSAPRY